MNEALAVFVRDRARGRCEYCRLAQERSSISFEIDHVIARKHGGTTSEDNLAFKTLEEVVEHYDKGGIKNPYLAKSMKPLHLTAQEKKDLVSFMKALSGEGWRTSRRQGSSGVRGVKRRFRLPGRSSIVP